MTRERRAVNVDITTGSILRLVGLLLIVTALWWIRSVVAIALFSFVFVSAVTPFVDALQRRRVPRALGITLIFFIVLTVLAVIVFLFGQLVADQTQQLAANLPAYYERAVEHLFGSNAVDQRLTETIQGWLQSFSNGLVKLSSQVLAGTIGLFGGFFTFVGILVLTFYLALEQDGLKRFLASVVPVSYLSYLYQLVDRIQVKLGGWVRGQLLLSLIIGAASFAGLLILGVDYAISLAIIAGLSELIPIAGPIIGAVPAIIVAFGQSPLLALFVAILYVIIQQLENNLIVPKVMQKTTGLNPIVILLAVLIGGTLAGFAGMVLAIPITLIIDVFFEDFFTEEGGDGGGSAEPTADA